MPVPAWQPWSGPRMAVGLAAIHQGSAGAQRKQGVLVPESVFRCPHQVPAYALRRLCRRQSRSVFRRPHQARAWDRDGHDQPASFLPVVNMVRFMTARARSMAQSELPPSFPQGFFLFAPSARSAKPVDFGRWSGQEVTLPWPCSIGSNGQSVKRNHLCKAGQNPAALAAVREGTTAMRGYIEEITASAVAAAIEDDRMDPTVTPGLPAKRTIGVKHAGVKPSLAAWMARDARPQEKTVLRRRNNHAPWPLGRVVIVPMVSNPVHAVVGSLGKVFLPPTQPPNRNDAECAVRVGPATDPAGNSAPGANLVRRLDWPGHANNTARRRPLPARPCCRPTTAGDGREIPGRTKVLLPATCCGQPWLTAAATRLIAPAAARPGRPTSPGSCGQCQRGLFSDRPIPPRLPCLSRQGGSQPTSK